jgi:hypothetical protein
MIGDKMATRKVHGIRVDEIIHQEPGNGLPKWVKQNAAKRGYGDALDPLSLFVTEDDIDEAFACVAQGDGAKCVMAQAGTRLGAKSLYFYRTTAWIDFGTGPILRFLVPKSIQRNIIDPFDHGKRRGIVSGVYPLTPPLNSRSLRGRKQYPKTGRRIKKSKRQVIAHTERVVLAAQVGSDES